MSRLSILWEIDDLSDQHCKGCDKRRELERRLPRGSFSRIDGFCQNECPIGQQIKELGQKLLLVRSDKYGTKVR